MATLGNLYIFTRFFWQSLEPFPSAGTFAIIPYMADAAPITDPTIPQVLLFGHVGSGKSSLLAALMRAGETQGETLHGEVQEPSGRLAEIRDAVYRGTKLARTETELMSYVVRVRPWRPGSADERGRSSSTTARARRPKP